MPLGFDAKLEAMTGSIFSRIFSVISGKHSKAALAAAEGDFNACCKPSISAAVAARSNEKTMQGQRFLAFFVPTIKDVTNFLFKIYLIKCYNIGQQWLK